MSNRIFRSEKDPDEVLWLMEWKSHEAFHKSGEEFNRLVNPAGEWDDVVWLPSDIPPIE